MPPVLDPMNDAFATRVAAGSIKKADPHAPRPVEHAFNLKKVGKGLDDHESAPSHVEAARPPKAVYVKKSRKELYDHKLELKPFNWFDQKKAQATLKTFNEHNKEKGEIVDVQYQIRTELAQKRDIIKNFDRKKGQKMFEDAGDKEIVNLNEERDKKLSVKVWNTFGQYIASNLKNGRAIQVPKLGIFTFTFPNHLDMAGLTNPGYRDPQTRTPVFVVSKDFVHGVRMKPGIAGSWSHGIHLNEDQSQSDATSYAGTNFSFLTEGGTRNKVIPFQMQNMNGIIPKHDINYTELARMVGDKGLTKSTCKDHLELIILKYSQIAHTGQRVDALIPHVGRLSITIGLCAVVFNEDLIAATRGNTAIIHMTRHHSASVPNNLMNTKILERKNSSLLKQNNFNVLKNQLDKQFQNQTTEKSIENMMDQIDQNFQLQTKRERQLRDAKVTVMDNIRKRPASSYGARSLKSYKSTRSSLGALSRAAGSVADSSMSALPDLDPTILMSMAWEIFTLRTKLVPKAQQQKIGLREVLTSSKLLKLLKTVNYPLKIGNLKALLRELGFNWNGSACSVTQLIEKLKQYTKDPHIDKIDALINTEKQLNQPKTTQRRMPIDCETLHKIMKQKPDSDDEVLKQIFYNTEKTLHQLFKAFESKNSQNKAVLSRVQFVNLVNQQTNVFSTEQIQAIFQRTNRKDEKELTFQEFERAFETVLIEKGQAAENQAVRKVRDWMHKRGYGSEDAFDRLLRAVKRGAEKVLNRYDFQKAVSMEIPGLDVQETDYLFDTLRGAKDWVDVNKWADQIQTVAVNPLTQIRDIIKAKNLTEQQIMRQLGLRLTDLPLDYAQFRSAILYYEPQFSDLQLKKLFTVLVDKEFNKVPVPKFLRNIAGTQLDTVDFQKGMLKALYNEIYRQNKASAFMKVLEQADKNNDGKLLPIQLGFFIKHCTGGDHSPFTDEQIERFVRQLPKVNDNKILYVQFLDLITSVGNRNHNPFKSLIHKLDFFLESNKLSIEQLLTRMDQSQTLSLETFAKFLKDKVEKHKDYENLLSYAKMMDIDKDGRICKDDLQTCLCNIDSEQFYKNGGQNLKHTQFNAENKFYSMPLKKLGLERSDPKIEQICQQILSSVRKQGLSYAGVFSKFDTDGDRMLNFVEFSKGIRSLISINQPTLETMFNLMDTSKIGMVDVQQFTSFLKVDVPEIDLIQHTEKTNWALLEEKALDSGPVTDSFEWQEDMVKAIRRWFQKERIEQRDLELTAQDVFKSFDIDFDGKVSKKDMKQALYSFCNINPAAITDIRMDRLFKLLSFHKQEVLQLSDFERLLDSSPDSNPFLKGEATDRMRENFKKSMGGGFAQTDVLNWKLACLQQIGLVISKKYSTIEKSFSEASQNGSKVNCIQFKDFIDRHNALEGFQMSNSLIQKLFGEVDPHKKTYLTLKDWESCFGTFSVHDQLLLEYKNFISTYFADVGSAFAYYQQFGEGTRTQIDFPHFEKATGNLMNQRTFTALQLAYLFQKILGDSVFHSVGAHNYRSFFHGTSFDGIQKISTKTDAVLKSLGKQGAEKKITKLTLQQSFGESILSRLRLLIQQSGQSLEDIFNRFDTDGSGELTRTEFRKALRAMNLGLTILEINEIIELIDSKDLTGHTRYDKVQGDGNIDYDEFASKVYNMPANEKRMLQRANGRLVEMKENMQLHMTSSADAFRMFGIQKKGFLTFKEFESLVASLCACSHGKMSKPVHLVLKDMFDTIDIGKDGVLDFREWQTTFQYKGVPESGTVNQPEPQTFGDKNAVKFTNGTSNWENGKEHELIGACIARNRNILLKRFKEESTHTSYDGQPRFVTFQQAKKAMDELIFENFTKKGHRIDDQRLAIILSAGAVQQRLTSQKDKEIPAFGEGYYEERPQKQNAFAACMYDFTQLLKVYKERYDQKAGIF